MEGVRGELTGYEGIAGILRRVCVVRLKEDLEPGGP
jgi:hypothetical protein